eukprot:jgi/Mesen1/2598/ME000166S01720
MSFREHMHARESSRGMGDGHAPAVLRWLAALLLLSSLAATSAQAQPPALSQRKYLFIIQRALDPKGQMLGSWFGSNPCAKWLGVTCNDALLVEKLQLSGYGARLGGTLSPYLASLTSLLDLTLDGNALKGPIPPQLGTLPQLKILDLSANSLTGGIPSLLGSSRSITKMNISYNPTLQGSIPAALGAISSLTYLTLGSSGLAGQVPGALGNLTKLYRLDLSGNHLSRSIPSTLGNCRRLNSLDLSYNQLQGSIPDSLGSLAKLAYLSLTNNYRLGGSIPDSLGRLTYLRKLDLSYNRLQGSVPQSLGNCRFLLLLSLSYNRLAGELPESLGNLTLLLSLKVKNNIITGSIPASFGNLKALQYLDASNNRLTGKLPASLGNLRSLEYLRLTKNNLYGAFPASVASIKRLSFLHIAYNQFSGPAPTGFASKAMGQPSGVYQISGNYFQGSPLVRAGGKLFCPPVQRNGDATGGQAENCLTYPPGYGCLKEAQKNQKKCRLFCNAASPLGPCSGHGSCFLSGRVPTCECNAGYTTGSTPDVCVLISEEAPPGTGLVLPGLGRPQSKYLNRYFRHLSAGFEIVRNRPNWRVLVDVDWRLYDAVAPIKSQGTCGACWAFAAAAAMESAWAIANAQQAVVPNLSEQQFLDCPGGGSCAGGWPGDALDYAAALSASPAGGGIVNQTWYPYLGASSGSCNSSLVQGRDVVHYGVVGYDQVAFYGSFGLLLAVQQQPIIGVYADPACAGGVVNHAVLLVGYNLKAAAGPYWIIRNSWGPGWGDAGYMYLAMTGGPGVCGINTQAALYPIIKGSSPCPDENGVGINPCGGGTCIPRGASNTCICPRTFVGVTNNDGSQTCAPMYACRFFLTNPCAVGTCVDDQRGSFSCICPMSYIQGLKSDGLPTCVPAGAAVPGQRYYYTAQAGVTCYLIYTAYSLSLPQFLALNRRLSCGADGQGLVPPGTVVDVTPTPASVPCAAKYAINLNDNCASIGAIFGLPSSGATSLARLNPGLNCSALMPGQQLCVAPGNYTGLVLCTNSYTVQAGDTCGGIISAAGLSALEFFSLNPGLYCANLQAQAGQAGGQQVCLSGLPPEATVCKHYYRVQKGDSCASIVFHKCNRSYVTFRRLNRGFDCQGGTLYVGLRLCVL